MRQSLDIQVTQDTTVVECWFKQSCLHGLARRIVIKKFRTFKQQVGLWNLSFILSLKYGDQVTLLGRYRSGVAFGRCWEWQEGGGYITGRGKKVWVL